MISNFSFRNTFNKIASAVGFGGVVKAITSDRDSFGNVAFEKGARYRRGTRHRRRGFVAHRKTRRLMAKESRRRNRG